MPPSRPTRPAEKHPVSPPDAPKARATRAAAAKTSAAEPGAELAPGARAPAFALASTSGGAAKLSDFAGKWLVVYFYPKDSTPGCTREACDFEASQAAFAKRGAAVVGVSRDSIASHERFRERQGLGFPLLSDPDAATHRAYGAWGEKTMYGKAIVGALRTTVLVDPKGKVARVWPRVKVDGHAADVLAALDELRA